MGSGRAGIPNPTGAGDLQEHHFHWNEGPKGAFNFKITKKKSLGLSGSVTWFGFEVLWGQHSTKTLHLVI